MDKEVGWKKNSNLTMKFIYSSGNLGNRWRYGHVTVRSNDPYQIAFEGIVGTSFQVKQRKSYLEDISIYYFIQGDIAIDDIRITNGPCENEGSCDFEQATFCGFYNTKEADDFDWTLNQGTTFSDDTG